MRRVLPLASKLIEEEPDMERQRRKRKRAFSTNYRVPLMKPHFVGVLGLEEFYNSLYPFYCTSQYSIINHGFYLYCRTEKGENRLQKMQPVRMPTSFSSTPVMSNDRKFCEPKWKQRTADTHQQHLEQLQSPSGQETKILLFGSSMMERFHTTGERYKTKYFDPRHVTIAGVGGDGIQHMLYRLDHGLLEACPPSLSLFVFQAGTNNIEAATPKQIECGIRQIIQEVQTRRPGIRMCLLGLCPRDSQKKNLSNASLLERIEETNTLLQSMAEEMDYLTYFPAYEPFLTSTRTKDPRFYDDHVHFNALGYGQFAKVIVGAMDSTTE